MGAGAFPCFLSLVAVFVLSVAQRFTTVDDHAEKAGDVGAGSIGSKTNLETQEKHRERKPATSTMSSEGNIQQESGSSLVEEGLAAKQVLVEQVAIENQSSMSISQIIVGMYHFPTFYWLMLLFLVSYVASSGAWGNCGRYLCPAFGLSTIEAGKLNSVATGMQVFLVL